ncbi:hypothetical protein GHT07_00955 [Caenimonas koreensis DSM 17982]|uniref:Uncharacterized protein n=1 Tax=Caenimonas koreensis DSM 17982 TaxID=1121255 RepID=A0A844AP63_9BURK|nr:hypothetical protein [Caenimonas koreensis]MRD45830.1 hypothetical protein [Caenimonas koreensis DSM 17982]
MLARKQQVRITPAQQQHHRKNAGHALERLDDCAALEQGANQENERGQTQRKFLGSNRKKITNRGKYLKQDRPAQQ